jgi:ABC-2 type transport system permease protein
VGPVFLLSLRQLSGKWRLGIIVLLAAVPILISFAVVSLAPGSETSANGSGGTISQEDIDNWTSALVGVLIVAAILPIVTMALATACFGNELEDRTLGYIVLNPVPRWAIVLSKMLAPVAIAGPAMILSGIAVAFIGLGGDIKTAVAVAVGLLAGIMTYSAIFVWAGLMTSHAIGFALLYVFLWEGLLSTLLEGVRYLSVRAYATTLMAGIDESRLAVLKDTSIELPAAIVGVVAVTVVFFAMAVVRLRRMDVP